MCVVVGGGNCLESVSEDKTASGMGNLLQKHAAVLGRSSALPQYLKNTVVRHRRMHRVVTAGVVCTWSSRLALG